MIIFNDSYQCIRNGEVDGFNVLGEHPAQHQIGHHLITVQRLPQEKYDGVPADTHSI